MKTGEIIVSPQSLFVELCNENIADEKEDMRKKELQIFLTMVLYCIKISYKASPFYTVVRVVVHVAVEVLGIIATYVAAGVMNILAGNLKGNAAEIICVLFMVMLLVEILSKLFNDIKSYCSGMHETLVSNYLLKSILWTLKTY